MFLEDEMMEMQLEMIGRTQKAEEGLHKEYGCVSDYIVDLELIASGTVNRSRLEHLLFLL